MSEKGPSVEANGEGDLFARANVRHKKIHTLVYDSCCGKKKTQTKREKESRREIERHDEYVGHLTNLRFFYQKRTFSACRHADIYLKLAQECVCIYNSTKWTFFLKVYPAFPSAV